MNKNKKIIIGFSIIMFIVIGVIISYKIIERSVINRENFKFNVENISSGPVDTISYEKDNNKSEENYIMENVNVIINSQKYNATIENNKTAKKFISLLPQEFSMKELNGNEKYIYMDNSLPTNSINPKHIESGDIMLYGDDCLVIFYKSFDTNYGYTKIGHIDNLPDLGNDNVSVKFEK